MGGKSDPYTVVKYGDQEFRTATIKKTLTPEWNEEFVIDTAEDGEKQIVFEVKDQDGVGKDESLGRTTVDVRRVSRQGRIDNMWDRLQGCRWGHDHDDDGGDDDDDNDDAGPAGCCCCSSLYRRRGKRLRL